MRHTEFDRKSLQNYAKLQILNQQTSAITTQRAALFKHFVKSTKNRHKYKSSKEKDDNYVTLNENQKSSYKNLIEQIHKLRKIGVFIHDGIEPYYKSN